MSGSADLLFEFSLSHTLLHQMRIWPPFLGRAPSLFTKYLTWLASQAKHLFSFGFGWAGFLLWLAQACTINIWQLRMWCSSAWTCCAAAGYTRLGQLKSDCRGTVLVKVWWVGLAMAAGLTHTTDPCLTPFWHCLDPFQLWHPMESCPTVTASG